MTNATTLERVKQYTEVALKAAGIKAKVVLHDEDADVHYIMVDDILEINQTETRKVVGIGGVFRMVPEWVLSEWVHDPGNYENPPDSYDREVGTFTVPADVAREVALHFVKDRIDGALEIEGEKGVYDDIRPL
jgi:hypothetical protein